MNKQQADEILADILTEYHCVESAPLSAKGWKSILFAFDYNLTQSALTKLSSEVPAITTYGKLPDIEIFKRIYRELREKENPKEDKNSYCPCCKNSGWLLYQKSEEIEYYPWTGKYKGGLTHVEFYNKMGSYPGINDEEHENFKVKKTVTSEYVVKCPHLGDKWQAELQKQGLDKCHNMACSNPGRKSRREVSAGMSGIERHRMKGCMYVQTVTELPPRAARDFTEPKVVEIPF